ncbi:uncharacterized protein [Amphiura filiformis]|uniref:uncharacterized protein n=1 Tax=Amphiura filiformis TaxID=82378 RepID=UPI003B219628
MGCVCSKEKGKSKKKASKISYTPVKSEQTKIATPKTDGKYQKLDAHDDDGDRKEGILSASIEDLKLLGKGRKGSGYNLLPSENDDEDEHSHHSDGDDDDENTSNNEIHIQIGETDPKEITEIKDEKSDISGHKRNDIGANDPIKEDGSITNVGEDNLSKSKIDDATLTCEVVESSNDDGEKGNDSIKVENATNSVDDSRDAEKLNTSSKAAENVVSNSGSKHDDASIATDNPSDTNNVEEDIVVEHKAGDTAKLDTKDSDEGVEINISNDITISQTEVEDNANITVANVDADIRIAENTSMVEIKEVSSDKTPKDDLPSIDTKAAIVPDDSKPSYSANTKDVSIVESTASISNSSKCTSDVLNVETEGHISNGQSYFNSGNIEIKTDDDQTTEPSVAVETSDIINAEKVNDSTEDEAGTEHEEVQVSLSQDDNTTEITLEITEPSDDNQNDLETQFSPPQQNVSDPLTKVINGHDSSMAENPEIQNPDAESNLQLNNVADESPSDHGEDNKDETNVNAADAIESVEMKNISEENAMENSRSSQMLDADVESTLSDNDHDIDNNEAQDQSLSSLNDNDDNHIVQNGNHVKFMDETERIENNNESFNKDQRNGIDNNVQEKDLTYEKAKSAIDASLQFLKSCKDPASDESWIFMKRLAVASCIVSSISNDTRRHLANHLVQTGFAQLFVNISRYLLANVRDSNSRTRKEDNLKVMKGTCTNFSTGNEFEPLVCELARQGAVGLLFEELDKSFPPKNDHELLHVVHTLNILSNCVRCTNSSIRQTYRNANAVNILMQYLKSNEIKLKMESLSILAYVMDDKEGDILGRTDGYIPCLIDVLKQAVAAEDYYVNYTIAGEPSGDGVYGLIDTMNRLVINDSCKRKVVQCDGIPPVIEILQIQGPDADDSQLAALETLWKIALIEKHQQILIQHILDSNVVPILTGMQSTSFPPSLRNASTGLLWKLGLVDMTPNVNSINDEGQTILLSYDVSNQKQARKLRDILVAAGFKVWMDENKTDGKLFTSMVNALGSCAAVLLCVSSEYKESIYCQTEATYAVELGKPTIPLRIEELYKVDGWLASLISTRQQFKAYSDDALEEDIEELIEELVECGCI